MTTEQTNTLNTKTVAFPLPLYKDALTRAMKNADFAWLDELFSQIHYDPDFILDDEGQTVWMLWNQICKAEKVKRKEKSRGIEMIMKDINADDCNYLYTLYKRGGIELLKKVTEIKTNIRINAHDSRGFTILDRLLDEYNATINDIEILHAAGYRFGYVMKHNQSIIADYYLKTVHIPKLSQEEEKNKDYLNYVKKRYEKRFHFLEKRITDAKREISGDFGRRLIVLENEDAVRRSAELNTWPDFMFNGCKEGIISLDQFEMYDFDFIHATHYITLDEILAGSAMRIYEKANNATLFTPMDEYEWDWEDDCFYDEDDE